MTTRRMTSGDETNQRNGLAGWAASSSHWPSRPRLPATLFWADNTVAFASDGRDRRLRIPAGLIEAAVVDRLRRLDLVDSPDETLNWTAIRMLIRRVDLGATSVTIHLTAAARDKVGGLSSMVHKLPRDDKAQDDGTGLAVTIALSFARRGGRTHALGPAGQTAVDRPDINPALGAALIRAEAWRRKLLSGEVATVDELAKAEGFAPTHATRILRMAFLAPDLKRMILEGRQPATLSLRAVMTKTVPLGWREQRRMVLLLIPPWRALRSSTSASLPR